MKILLGKQAYTEIRLSQLQQQLQQQTALPPLKTVTEFYIISSSNSELTATEAEQLCKVLNATMADASATIKELEKQQQMALVVPRFGTISPWSSKALDVLSNAGLKKITQIEKGKLFVFTDTFNNKIDGWQRLIHDPLTENLIFSNTDLAKVFAVANKKSFTTINIIDEGAAALTQLNQKMGLSFSDNEISYLYDYFIKAKRNPTDVEIMMFAQANSEHCRHKTFRAPWKVNGKKLKGNLFSKIKNTYKHNPNGVISAYDDNAAVLAGNECDNFGVTADGSYRFAQEQLHYVLKVETHNHPTAIAPNPGAATGAGGEIRDAGATGVGAKPKAGLYGLAVSNLNIPSLPKPWEKSQNSPQNLATPLQIMLEAPIGACNYNNEFGRANIAGFFRSFEHKTTTCNYGYYKPIMLAGGIGNIRQAHTHKKSLPVDTLIVVLGGPAMLIGLGGGALSSASLGKSSYQLDFASVQRANPELERRAQEVINSCIQADENPILSIHDVGAGGLSNAVPEIVAADNKGAVIELDKIPSADPGLSPLELWCNEAQERYVIALQAEKLEFFKQICQRERCKMAVIGKVTADDKFIMLDSNQQQVVNFDNSFLFADVPLPTIELENPDYNNEHASVPASLLEFDKFSENLSRVLSHPTVADKSFLITIGDRSVGGLVAQQQMVGPWQTPIADVAVTASSYNATTGEALALGERPPIAIIDAAASVRIAIAEAITNIAASDVTSLQDVKLSGNWMVAAKEQQQALALYQAVTAAEKFCISLGLSIPVGKDSTSMSTVGNSNGRIEKTISPLSLVITAAAKVNDINKTLTPEIRLIDEDTELLFVDLSNNKMRLGGSIVAQVHNYLGNEVPDVTEPELLNGFFKAMQALKQQQLVLAYHDKSDGGLITTLIEMAFAANIGLTINFNLMQKELNAWAFNEEVGAVLQIKTEDYRQVAEIFAAHGLLKNCKRIGTTNNDKAITIFNGKENLFKASLLELKQIWSRTSAELTGLRSNPNTSQQEYQQTLTNDIKLYAKLPDGFEFKAPYIATGNAPKVAILREQGVNGHQEMAAAFHLAGFDAHDVHMTDLISGKKQLDNFVGLAVCGGFSYGDVLGAGRGWALSILHNSKLRQQFYDFFHRSHTFTLGVCNGCQMLSNLQQLIPGAQNWPQFKANISGQFESRLSMVKINSSPSILLKPLAGAELPIVVAHGEGRAEFTAKPQQNLIAMQYAAAGNIATSYPQNPNGSDMATAAITTTDGRATILMPHPERVFKSWQLAWRPTAWLNNSPWFNIFIEARKYF